jgi:hypothetical protein
MVVMKWPYPLLFLALFPTAASAHFDSPDWGLHHVFGAIVGAIVFVISLFCRTGDKK